MPTKTPIRSPWLARHLATWLMLFAFVCRPLAAAEPSQTDMERAEAKAIEAKAFFQSGLFARAADGFMQAYAISKKPEMMFNAARAYEEAAMPAEAIALFEQYGKLADATDGGRKDAREHTARQRALLTGAAPPVRPAAPPAKPVEPEKPAPDPRSTKEAARPAAQPVVASASPSNVSAVHAPSVTATAEPQTRSTAVTVALLAGGGLLVLGAIAGYADAVDKMEAANKMDFSVADAQKSYDSQVKVARDQRTSDVVVGILGAGLAGWGAWRLWGPEPSAKPTAQTTWMAPTFSATTAGMALGGSF